MSQAIEPKFLKTLRNPVTHLITQSVLDFINVLKSRYDRVNIMQLNESKTSLKAFIYKLMETIDKEIFQKIKDYSEVAEMINAPKSECQKIDLAIFVFINLKKFQV